jgi:hypothetical protein
MMMTMRCGTTHVSHWLAKHEGSSANTVRQRVREWYYEASAKRGQKRREIQVEEHFADLLAWVLEGWEGEKRLVIVLDATTLSERFTSLSVGVVLGGCLIPVAWYLLPANQPGEWQTHWLRLVELLGGAIPRDWHVVVMTDRGLYAAWLYRAIQENHWHPMMRVNEMMGFRAEGEEIFRPIGERVSRRGRGWTGAGEWSEQGERVRGTLMVRWEAGYEEKLAVVTDETGEDAEVAFYQMRFWTEDGFKDQKRGGWRWEQTKMSDPQRASRLWLVMAVTMLWAVRVGSEEEGREQAQHKRQKHTQPGKRGRPRKQFHRPRAREQSVIVRGQQTISVAATLGRELPLGHVRAQPWPRHLYAVGKPASSWEKKRKRRQQRRRARHRVLSWKQRHQLRLQHLQEQEAKRQARQEQRLQHLQEQEAKRQARLQRQQEQEAKRQRLAQQREARAACQTEQQPATPPLNVCIPPSASPRPLVGLHQGRLLPVSQPAPQAGRSRPQPVLRARVCILRPLAQRPLVGLRQRRLVLTTPLGVQEIPP